jgi:aminoglycoside phosphotransferase (APT) family kinase protein
VIDAGETERLRSWLVEHAGAPDGAPAEVEVLAGGASNLTLAVTVGDRRLVVRRPPIGHFLPTAHDMGREHRIYRAVHGTGVPVPEPLAYCDDESVLGAPFQVMGRVDCVVPNGPDDLAGVDAATNARTAAAYVEVLGAIHALDVDEIGLGGLAKREGYLARQVARWTDQWERSKDGSDVAAIDDLAARLPRALPEQRRTTLVHGDYRLGNCLLDPADTGRIAAVVDWEMATLGDPLADLGYAVLWWGSTDRVATSPSQLVADLPGFPTADELVEAYRRRSGDDADGLDFHVVLAAFKLAVIAEGQRARLRRTGQDVGAAGSVEPLAGWAVDYADRKGVG